MKNVLIRGFLAGAAFGSALLIGLAAPATGAESCALVVVCTSSDPAQPAPDQSPPSEPTQPQTATPPAEPAHRSSAEVTADLLDLLNRDRAAHGLPLFTRRGDVDQVAAGWSDHLAEQNQLSHNDAYFTEQSRREHGGRALGENVAMDAEAQPAHEHLMASPHHRDNILDARFTVVGLGATYRKGSWWITEDFLQPASTPTTSHEVARSMPAPPAKRSVAPTAAAPHATPQAPPQVAPPTVPVAQVEAASVGTPRAPHWLTTRPGVTREETSALPMSSSHSGLPAPVTGIAFAGLAGVGGLLLRRRAFDFATS
jgi:uncharacterized protein YkwD